MKVADFLQHYGIHGHPFASEDAKGDPVFSPVPHTAGGDPPVVADMVHHSAWDKIFGTPREPASAVVFGQKGSGKTALNIQMAAAIEKYNRERPDARAFLVRYDDFNPFLDQFARAAGSGGAALDKWQLWDHVDAVLSLATRQLVGLVLATPRKTRGDVPADGLDPAKVKALSRADARDLLMLAAVYDRHEAGGAAQRFDALRRRLGFGTGHKRWGALLALFVTALLIGGGVAAWYYRDRFTLPGKPWMWAAIAAAILLVVWVPTFVASLTARRKLARQIAKQVRVVEHDVADLRHALRAFRRGELEDQPVQHLDGTDARYVLLNKLQGVLQRLGYTGVIVLVDRVDEPHLINGRADLMHAFMRSIFDLKLLKHPRFGVKLLLPGEMYPFLHREGPEFQQRARLDKQNYIPALEWSGQSLYDVANERIRAFAEPGKPAPLLVDFMEEDVTDRELIELCGRLRIPRHLFKFLYQLLAAHCQTHVGDKPVWRVSKETLHTTFALFARDVDRYAQGMMMG